MKILLLGVGLQGKTALYDLDQSDNVAEIIAADVDINGLKLHVREMNYKKVICQKLDATNQDNIDELMKLRPDVVIDLLPVAFNLDIVKSAIKNKVNLVNTCYPSQAILDLDEEVKNCGITILPEFGFDPGIDLVILGEAIRDLKEIELINSYGAGIPEPEACDNPLNYKITWTFEGVLRSYYREGKLIRDGQEITIKANEMFNPENIHYVEIEEIGKLEAIPNGDAVKYLKYIGIDDDSEEKQFLRDTGRYSMRWPGHSEFWKKLVDLHMLDDELVEIEGKKYNRRKILAKLLEPQLQLKPNERDIAVILVDVIGKLNDERTRVRYQVIDRRDLETGFTAMSRLVGYTASIGAQIIGMKKISKKGILSPVKDIPYNLLCDELLKRNVHVSSNSEKLS
ncbi:MAG: hypothetical protein FK730_07410 [Asgard group archaeon]|nr:hypothetical protein [Asgard group archaeon]